MARYVGLWLDHKKAIIATYTGGDNTIERIDADFMRETKSTGGDRGSFPYVFDGGGAPKRRANKINELRKHFYKDIYKKIAKADKVLLMGPGVAKQEFLKFCEEFKPKVNKMVEVENKSKMTNAQIAAQTRKYFKLKNEATERKV